MCEIIIKYAENDGNVASLPWIYYKHFFLPYFDMLNQLSD